MRKERRAIYSGILELSKETMSLRIEFNVAQYPNRYWAYGLNRNRKANKENRNIRKK